VSSIFFAVLLLTDLAASERSASIAATPVSMWEQYPTYSKPPVVAAAVTVTRKEPPTPEPIRAPAPSPAPASQASQVEARVPLIGAIVDAGVPDGAAASITLRPWRWLRIQAGGMHNTISPGLRGGISLVPFYYWITPSLNLEAGHYFPGDATWIARRLTPNRNLDSLFQRVGYDFGNAQLGLELGSPRGATFFVRAGVSYVQTTGRGIQQALQDPTLQAGNVKLTGVIPSAKIGMIFFF
jgi:hypothetical protein